MCFFSITMLLIQTWAGQLGAATVVILLFLLPWAAFCALQPSAAILSLTSNWPLLALPLFCIFSAVWSEYPDWSLRAGTQFTVTTMIGIWMATWVKPRTFLSALLVALALVVALSALMDISRGSFGTPFTGIFGSKNAFASCVGWLLFLAVVVAPDRSQSRAMRWIGFAAVVLAPPLLVLAQSTGASVFAAATITIITVLALSVQLPPAIRFVVFVLLLLFGMTTLICASLYFGDVAGLLDSLGKDSTLTGRTVLWEAAERIIAAHPVLGLGYQAFWQQGNWGAEVLWQYAHIMERAGFHFHNIYLQIAVDLGLVGLSIFVATILGLVLRLISTLVFSKPRAEQMFAIAIVIYFLFRTPIEIDLFYQFNIASIFICLAWVYLKSPRPQDAATHFRSVPPVTISNLG
jgi:exopolysaccharide production protein ExoQ